MRAVCFKLVLCHISRHECESVTRSVECPAGEKLLIPREFASLSLSLTSCAYNPIRLPLGGTDCDVKVLPPDGNAAAHCTTPVRRLTSQAHPPI
jgi:hypothetical protein